MTFLEKIHQKIKHHTGAYESNLTRDVSVLADDYAISFGEWLEKLRDSVDRPTYDLYLRNKTKELLKDFKEQKQL